MENAPKMDDPVVPGCSQNQYFSRPLPKIAFWMHIGRPLAPFGCLLAPFRFLLIPFGCLLDPFRCQLAHFFCCIFHNFAFYVIFKFFWYVHTYRNEIYDIGTEILKIRCVATNMTFSFCKACRICCKQDLKYVWTLWINACDFGFAAYEYFARVDIS